MKTFRKFAVGILATAAVTTAGAGGISGVLDGMFSNVTAPDVVSSQFRGTITGGSVYLRVPNSNIQLISFDPPRLSIGCGGIDAYGGSFSFITRATLTEFFRKVAQAAGPIAFKMAIDATFPQLGGVIEVFNKMAQDVAGLQKNSCEMAKGILAGAANSQELENNLKGAWAAAKSTADGWYSDMSVAVQKMTEKPSETQRKMNALADASGKKVVNEFGNITWNVIKARKDEGMVYSITDDTYMGQQILMSLIGTKINKEGATDDSDPLNSQLPPNSLRLRDLFKPQTLTNGKKGVPIWTCDTDKILCQTVTAGVFETTGVEGYIKKQMYGTEDPEVPAVAGSIIDKLTTCNASKCGVTPTQLRFLNSLGSIPAVALLMRAQRLPTTIDLIAPTLVEMMIDELSVAYARSVIDLAVKTFSNTTLPRPDDFATTIKTMREDLRDAESASKTSLEKINQITVTIDTAIRTNGSILTYKPH